MVYVELNESGNVAAWATEKNELNQSNEIISRHELQSDAHATWIADQLTTVTGIQFLAVDAGENVFPRFDIIKAPTVGDDVSMTYKGDFFPVGKIVSISPTARVITTTAGKRFYRKHKTGSWIYDGTWSLVPGVHTGRAQRY